MDRIKVVIADSKPSMLTSARHLLNADPDFIITAQCVNGKETAETILTHRPDLIFIDVQMHGMNGFELWESIQAEYQPLVVFVAHDDKYALKAFDAGAIDYLLKPFPPDRFYRCLYKVKNTIKTRYASPKRLSSEDLENIGADPVKGDAFLKKISIKSNGRIYLTPVDTISYIESEGNFVKVFVNQEMKIASYTFKQLEKILDPRQFLRVHKSYIVNINKIEALEPYSYGDYVIHTQSKNQIKLSRNYKGALHQIMYQQAF